MPNRDSTPRISLRDVAVSLGISHVTVSLALRGDPRISAPRKEEVAAAAKRLGYRPDPMLSSLSAYRQAKTPAVVRSTLAWLNQWTNPKDLHKLQEFEAYWRGANEAAAQLGYRLEEFKIGADLSSDRLQKILSARGIQGILIPPHFKGLDLPGFDWSQFSIVRLGISVKHPRAHVVTSDQINCSSLAFERLRERGYARIGYVTSRAFDRNTGGNFRAGYLSMQDALVPLRAQLHPLIFEEEDSQKNLRQLRLWLKSARPDAVIASDRSLAKYLVSLGCKVPDDLAVATVSVLDGNFDAGVDQNSYEVGLVALRTLASLIHQNERGIPRYCRRILVEGRWVDGTSVPLRQLPKT
ncbi:LacI family DNA-binding transcriptional regulator [Oleiharenicola lentus]|uniref:LacI family DNA-binding transcriptional regulator n=1 Tax=Oleiharenicola lentus TaxID=2508720 RepID=UPI003F670CED